MTSGVFETVKILGSIYACYHTKLKKDLLEYLVAEVYKQKRYFYLEDKGDTTSPTFESEDYVLVKKEKKYNNNNIRVTGLNEFESIAKKLLQIDYDSILFDDNIDYELIKPSDEQGPYVVGVLKIFYINTMNYN